jgi:hypothetical protein
VQLRWAGEIAKPWARRLPHLSYCDFKATIGTQRSDAWTRYFANMILESSRPVDRSQKEI